MSLLLLLSALLSSRLLEASADNIQGDVYSAAAVLFGLLLVHVAELTILDSLLDVGVSEYLVKIIMWCNEGTVFELVGARSYQGGTACGVVMAKISAWFAR